MTPIIGQRIRDRRNQLNLTLRELADKVGVTSSFLSYVERGVVSPSLTSLARIVEELGVPLAYIFSDGATASQAVRAAERPSLKLPDSNVSYELLTRYPGSRMGCMVVHLEPGTSSFDTPKQHPQEQCVLLLQGRLKVELGTETFFLEEGDSTHYDGLIAHRFVSVGEQGAVYLLVVAPLTI
jgi:transcriptional regulator with XRE-family HTH domain